MSKKEYDRGYYLKNQDKILARKRGWYKRQTPEKKKSISEKTKLRTYGITTSDYARLCSEQHGQCAICGISPFGQALHVDHCHETGKVRGLLCLTCNAGIGLLKDDPDLCYAASIYLTTEVSVKAA